MAKLNTGERALRKAMRKYMGKEVTFREKVSGEFVSGIVTKVEIKDKEPYLNVIWLGGIATMKASKALVKK